MSKKIHPKSLRINLWRPGPYLVFFSGKHKDINPIVVENIKEIAKRYQFIIVLEVDWEEYVEYELKVSSDEMKNILVYFKGKIEICEKYPDAYKIEQIFQKCQEFFNIALEEKNSHKLEFRKNFYDSTKKSQKKGKKTLTDEQKFHISYRNILSQRRYNMKIFKNKITNYNKIYNIKTNKSNINNIKLAQESICDQSNVSKTIIPFQEEPKNIKSSLQTIDLSKNYLQINSVYNKSLSYLPYEQNFGINDALYVKKETSSATCNKYFINNEIFSQTFSPSIKNHVPRNTIFPVIPNSCKKQNHQ